MSGKVKMADISKKSPTKREAVAIGFIKIAPDTLSMVREGRIPKGDIEAVSKTAGIAASKMTPAVLPLCHPVSLTSCDIDIELESSGVKVRASLKAEDRTGVEMEALFSCATALLNIYDMVKPVDKSAEIAYIKLVKKTGGKSGDYERES